MPPDQPSRRQREHAAPELAFEAEVVTARRPAREAKVPSRRPSRLSNRATEALLGRLRARAKERQAEQDRQTADPALSPASDTDQTEPKPETLSPETATPTPTPATAIPETASPDTATSEKASPDNAVADDNGGVADGGVAEAVQRDVVELENDPLTPGADLQAEPLPGDSAAPQPDGSDAEAAEETTEVIEPDVDEQVGPEEDISSTSGPEVAAWRSRVGAATNNIETPTLRRAPVAAEEVAAEGQRLRQGRQSRREAIADDADAAVSDAPQGQEVPEPRPEPPPDPVPEATALIEAEASHFLTPAKLPDLGISPRGTQALDQNPETAQLEPEEPTSELDTATQNPGAAGDQQPAPEDAATVEEVGEATEAPIPDLPPGTAEGITIADAVPPERPPFPPMLGNVVREVLARLVADPAAQAEPIITESRKLAYPNEVLPRVYPDIGNDRLSDVTETVSTGLEAIRIEAGISAEDMDASVAARVAEVQSEADAAIGAICIADEVEQETTTDDGGAEQAEVEAVEEAQNQHAAAVVEAASGEGNPQVIDARADEQLRKLNRWVGNLRFDYARAKDRRHASLERAKTWQNRAYDKVVADDTAAISNAVDEPDTLTERLQQAEIRFWAGVRKESVATAVQRLKTEATTEAEGFRQAVTDAGTSASEAIRDWAAAEKGETRTWWDSLFELFDDWSHQAEVEAENWSVVRAGEARDATIQNLQTLSGFVESQGEAVNLETNEAYLQLSKEQQMVIKAYYDSPADNRDSLGAVAAGLRFRLLTQQRPTLIEAMKREVLAGENSEASNLQQIGMAQKETFDAEQISSRLYSAMFGGLTGWGTDEDKIYDNLTGLTAVQGRAVRATYAMDANGRSNLDADLKSELDEDNALIRAKAALDGDPIMETVGALNEAMAGLGTDEETIMKMLRGKTAEQRASIVEEYRRQYGVDLTAALDSEMDDHDQHRAEALLEGDTARADAIAIDQAMHGGVLGWGTDNDAIEAVYGQIRDDVSKMQVDDPPNGRRPMDREEMEAEIARRSLDVEASYNRRYGSPDDQESALRAAYRDEMSGPDLDLANALADNNLAAADAARLRREQLGFYTSDDAVNVVLEDQYGRALETLQRDPEWRARRQAIQAQATTENWNPYQIAEANRVLDRQMEQAARVGAEANMSALEETFDEAYSPWGPGGVDALIHYNMSGTDREKAQKLVGQGGYLSPAQRIDFATRGAGTDEAEFEKAVAGRTRAEIDDINTELADMGRDSVEELASSELSGRDEFDMNLRLRGVPEDAEQEMRLAQDRVDWERRNSPVTGAELDVMNARLARMREQYELINDPDADPFERQRAMDQFRARGSGVEAGVEGYREQVDALTDAVATGLALAVAVTVTIATGGIAGAVLGALYAAVTTMVVKTAMKGAAYGVEDMAVDAVVGAVDAAAALATAGIGNALMRVAAGGGSRFTRTASTRMATTLSHMANSGSRVQRVMAHGLAEATEGAIGSVPSALAGNILNDKNWERSNPFVNILKGTLTETAMGAVVSGGIGGALSIRTPRVDPPTPRSGDILANRGTPQDRLTAWRAHRAENPDASMASFLTQYDQQVSRRLAAETTDATVQRALRTELLAGIPSSQRKQFAGTRIEIMSDADFRAFTRSDSANAVTLIDGGRPRVILRDGAPPGVLREEGIHLQQIAEPDLGRLARRLDEGRLADWDSLPLGEKMELYAIKVDLEIDAQIKLINSLDLDIRRAGPGGDVAPLQRQRAVAMDSLDILRRRADAVADIGPLERIAMSKGVLDPPSYLDQPARLFNKTKVGDKVGDSPLARAEVAQDGDVVKLKEVPDFETSKISLGERSRIRTKTEHGEVTIGESGGELYYYSRDGRRRGVKVKPGTKFSRRGNVPDFIYSSGRTVDAQQQYRVVELVGKDGTIRETRGEALALSHRDLKELSWQQRGSDIVKKGRDAELAAQVISAEQVLDPRFDVVGSFMVQRADGTGFDLVEVRIDQIDGMPVLTVNEVKNVPGNYAPYETFTAVSTMPNTGGRRGNLETNLDDLHRRLTPTPEDISLAHDRATTAESDFGLDDIAEMMEMGPHTFFQARAAEMQGFGPDIQENLDYIMSKKLGIEPAAYAAARQALADGRFELMIVLTPTSKIGFSGDNNLFDRLQADWQALVGQGMIRELRLQGAVTMRPQHLQDAQAALTAMKQLKNTDPNVDSEVLTFSGLLDAPYLDSQGNVLAVRPIGPGEANTGLAVVADEIADRLRYRLPLPSGAHANLKIVIDLTDIVGDTEIIKDQLLGHLQQLGLSPERLARVLFVHHRK